MKFQKADFKEEKLSSLMLKIWLIQHHRKDVTLEWSAVYRRQPAGTSGRVGRPLVARENWYKSSTELSVPQTLVPLHYSRHPQGSRHLCYPAATIGLRAGERAASAGKGTGDARVLTPPPSASS